MSRFSRRTALKSLGALALSPALKGCSGASPDSPLSSRIENVVVLMMENRSFDHYFGALRLEGRTEIDGVDPSMSNPDKSGAPVFVHLADKGCIVDPSHSWNSSHRQFNEGKNDGFVTLHAEREGDAEGPRVMGYLDRAMLPASYALADRYALSNRWFASLMTSTWPNRFYSLGAQNGGERTNEFAGDYSFLNVLDRMEEMEKSFGFYFGNVSFASIFPRHYPDDTFRDLERFYDDAAAGTLPALTWVEPIYGRNDDHPPAHPLAGQILISTVYDALAKSPQWNKTLFVLNYDEHGGFFDHVPPPKTTDDRAADGFDQLGFRVPSLVMGPWVKERYVSDLVRDHTSVLSFLTTLWGMRPLTSRDRAANDLTELLDLDRIEANAPAAPIALPIVEADESVIYAPECSGRGLAYGGTGQVELEAFLDQRPGHIGDRRTKADASFEYILRYAEKRGLLRRTSSGF